MRKEGMAETFPRWDSGAGYAARQAKVLTGRPAAGRRRRDSDGYGAGRNVQ